MGDKSKISLIVLFFSYCCFAFSQRDSSKYLIRIGNDFTVTPILHFNNNFNLAPGFFFHINFDNALIFKMGYLYHLKQYTVIEDKYWSPDTKTTFNYYQIWVKLDVALRESKKSQLFFSLGALSGKGIYKEGIENNYPIDYMNHPNQSLEIGFGYKYQLFKKISLNIEPCFVWFEDEIPSGYAEYGPSPYPSLTKLTGTNSRTSLFTMISITYDYINIKKKKAS